MSGQNEALILAMRLASRLIGLTVAGIGVASLLIGWLNPVTLLLSPNLSILFLLCGNSLWVPAPNPPGTPSSTIQLIKILIALAIIAPATLQLAEGVLLNRTALPSDSLHPSHLFAAVCGLFAGLALFFTSFRPRSRYWPAQSAAFGAGALALLAIIGHVYGSYGIASYTGMPLIPALLFLAVSLGVLFVHPNQGLMAILTSDGAGGAMARRLTLAVIGIPSLLGLLRLEGERRGYYDGPLGVSLLILSIIACFFTMIWWYARFLNRTDEQRRNAEESLERQRTVSIRQDRLRSLGELSAGIAHELNQPLVGVRGLAEHVVLGMDRGWALSPDKIREKLQGIIEQADRMTHIIHHVRLFSRDAGKSDTQPVSFNETVLSAISMIDAQFRSHGVTLETDLMDGLPPVAANPYSLEEVILNLLTNARDAMEDQRGGPGDATVLIKTQQSEENGIRQVMIQVIDKGVGIPTGVLPNVFEPFFTTKGTDNGTGLGLAICKSIVEQVGVLLALNPQQGAALQ